MRLTKLARYSKSIRMLGRIYSAKKSDLIIVFVGQFVALLLVSDIMWLVEGDVQPEAFSSIPQAMWWSVTTLTTVGYGDIVPVTVLGRILAMLVALLGVALFAMPAGILAAGFIEELDHRASPDATCPHCSLPLHSSPATPKLDDETPA